MSEYGKHYEKMKLRLNLSKGKETDEKWHAKKTSEEIAADTQGVTVQTYDTFGNPTGSYQS